MTIFDRLCDTSLYTGAHKHRFDQNGNGRGLGGRDSISKGRGHVRGGGGGGGVSDLSQITRTNLDNSGGTSINGSSVARNAYRVSPPPGMHLQESTFRPTTSSSHLLYPTPLLFVPIVPSRTTPEPQPLPTRSMTPAAARPSTINQAAASWRAPVPDRCGTSIGRRSSDVGESYAAYTRPSTSVLRSGRASADGGGGGGAGYNSSTSTSIFDRLTDARHYTGAHRNRFDSRGAGLGAFGRTTAGAYVDPAANVRR